MEYKYIYAIMFVFVFVLSVGMVSAVTYRHDGTDVMVLDDDGNLTVAGTLDAGSTTIVGDLNVTGTSYLDDVTINSDNITVNNIIARSGGEVAIDGNVSTVGTGFFGWLGSLVSRITGLFVTDIDFDGTISSDSGNLNISASDGNIDTSGNVTADYLIGNGSLLTNIAAASIADGAVANVKIAANAVNTTQIIDGTISAVDLAADSVNGTHVVDNVGLRNTNVAGNLNVTQNVTIGGSTLYEDGGELIIEF